MPSNHQLCIKGRYSRKYKNKRLALCKCPQKKAVVLRVFEKTPRKPNSALRKVARVKLTSTKKDTWAYIPGMTPDGQPFQRLVKFSQVLIRGGRTKDLPGLKYKIIHGKLDLKPLVTRRTALSKFGLRKFFKTSVDDYRYRRFTY